MSHDPLVMDFPYFPVDQHLSKPLLGQPWCVPLTVDQVGRRTGIGLRGFEERSGIVRGGLLPGFAMPPPWTTVDRLPGTLHHHGQAAATKLTAIAECVRIQEGYRQIWPLLKCHDR